MEANHSRAAIIILDPTVGVLALNSPVSVAEIGFGESRTIVASVYISPNEPCEPVLEQLELVARRTQGCPLLIAGDFNAKSPVWGGNPQRLHRRIPVEAFVGALDLSVCNDPTSPPHLKTLKGSHGSTSLSPEAT